MTNDKQRKKYDNTFKLTKEDDFDLEIPVEENIENKKPRIKPGDFKYPINKNFINESKEKFQLDDEFKSAYADYEYMLGDLWEKEALNVKHILKDFSECPTNDNLFIDVINNFQKFIFFN